jgi:hypothetical protein
LTDTIVCDIVILVMTKFKVTKAVKLLHQADRLMAEAMRLLPKNRRFTAAVCDTQIHLDDAITLADLKQTKLVGSRQS